jgi:hypothetical protein
MYIAYAAYTNIVAIRSNISRSALLWVFTHLYNYYLWRLTHCRHQIRQFAGNILVMDIKILKALENRNASDTFVFLMLS